MKKCKDIIYNLLENDPKLRDSDISLIQEVWKEQSELGCYFEEKPIWYLFELMTNKVLSHPSSIKRARAKLQELHIHLRGKMYDKRHKLQKDTLFDLDTMGAEGTGTGY